MATLWVSEYTTAGRDQSGQPMNVGQEPGLDTAIDFTAPVTLELKLSTRVVRLNADADFHRKVSKAGDAATTSNARYKADPEYFIALAPGGPWTLAIIAAA